MKRTALLTASFLVPFLILVGTIATSLPQAEARLYDYPERAEAAKGLSECGCSASDLGPRIQPYVKAAVCDDSPNGIGGFAYCSLKYGSTYMYGPANKCGNGGTCVYCGFDSLICQDQLPTAKTISISNGAGPEPNHEERCRNVCEWYDLPYAASTEGVEWHFCCKCDWQPTNTDQCSDDPDDDDNSDDDDDDTRIEDPLITDELLDQLRQLRSDAYTDYTSAKTDAWDGYQSAKADARETYEDQRAQARVIYDSYKTAAQETYSVDTKAEARSEYDQAKLEARADYDEAKASALSAYNTVRENYNDAREASSEAWETYKQDRTEENYNAYLEAKADLEAAKEERTEAYEQYDDARVEAQSAFAQAREDARAAYTAQREQAREVYEEAREEIKNTYEQSGTDARALYDQVTSEARSEYEDIKTQYFDAYLEAKADYEAAKKEYDDARDSQ
ncbi:hypothetical protein KKC44_01950 [Patescibacteria group bacterium]|nr:hypothetical protein [Patescibacteria group bacterium]MBU2259345.1 hypothetical protein [Patescibacteria group bacterium]